MDTNQIEALRNVALAHNEVPFAHLCTEALAGEQWAADRVADALTEIDDMIRHFDHSDNESPIDAIELEVIRATDTTRPDGAIARRLEV